jgi:hypothetical protein
LAGGGSTQYSSFSFVDPVSSAPDVHLVVTPDGMNIVINIKTLSNETRAAVQYWFAALEKDPARNAAVEKNLPRLARRQTKVSELHIVTEDGHRIVTEDGSALTGTLRYPTTSST